MQRLARMRQAREQLNIAALDAPSSVKASLPKPPPLLLNLGNRCQAAQDRPPKRSRNTRWTGSGRWTAAPPT